MLDGTANKLLQSDRRSYGFGRFVLHGRERLFLAAGEPIELGSRAFEILLMLVESAGDLVIKGDILDRAWSGIAVEENNLQVQVSTLRRVLGADRHWIVTITGQGYRFTAPVTALSHDCEPTASYATAHLSTHAPAHAAAKRKPPRLSILVLPLVDHSDEPAPSRFTEGMTDSLMTDLARALPTCTVFAHTPASTKNCQPSNVREIASAYGVRYVLKGSMLLSGEHIRVNAQLIEAESGSHVWAERFDKHRLDALQAQDEIVGRLSRSAGLQMIACEARRAEQEAHERPDETTAQDFVLRGHAAANQPMMTRQGFATACALYERAVEREPGNADALSGIAGVRVYQVLNGYLEDGRTANNPQARAAHLAEAEEKLTRALAAAPGHFGALKARALLLRARGAFAGALVAAETLLAHSPSEPMSYREVGLNLLYLGRTEDAVRWFRRADALVPSDPIRWTWLQGLGRALIHLGRDKEAAEALRLAIDSNPAHAPFHALLAAALMLAGDHERARMAMAQFRNAEPATTMDMLAWRSAVPLEATDRLYRSQNERLLHGFRVAGHA
jgi:TolB-like protein/Flp pilus assembly protein TadD